MIRMGRSNKTEPISETPKFQENYSNNSESLYGNNQESQFSTNRATDAEAIIREIKDGRLSGFVGHGTVLSGEMNFQAMLRVDGQLSGRIASENGTLVVGATGRIDANVMVFAAVINGIVKGDIIATEKIELGRTAQVIGNIQAPRLVMGDGAILEGNCTMIKAKELSEKRAADGKPRLNESDALDMTRNPGEKSEAIAS